MIKRRWSGSGLLMGGKGISLYIAIIPLCLLTIVKHVSADDVSVKVVENGILDSNLVMKFQAEGVFTEKVIKFLSRGFTVRIDYTIELWQSRKWWFDHLDSQRDIYYQIDFEPLEKRYTCRISQQAEVIKSRLAEELDSIVQWTTRPEFPISIVPIAQLDPESSYYYNIIVSIATLTAENISDLRKWIKIGEEEKESSTLTKTSFKLAKDAISARHRKRVSTRFEKFQLHGLSRLGG